MKTEEITVGEFYEAKVNGRLVNVKVQKQCGEGLIRVLSTLTNRTAYITAGKFTRGPLRIGVLTKPAAAKDNTVRHLVSYWQVCSLRDLLPGMSDDEIENFVADRGAEIKRLIQIASEDIIRAIRRRDDADALLARALNREKAD